MPKPLDNKHAVITGGGTGIGAAIADQLGELGASVTLMGRQQEPLDSMVKSLTYKGVQAKAVQVDVADETSVETAFKLAGDFDILINNAGLAESAPLTRTSLEHWNKTLAVNLTGVFLCCKQAVTAMKKKDYARIVTVASTAGLTGYAYVSAYCAAKHGVIGLTKSLAKELARTSITVNAVCPGYTETSILSDSLENIMQKTNCTEEQARGQLLADNPQGRFIQPLEVANMVSSLCLPASGSVNGQALAVDGGETA